MTVAQQVVVQSVKQNGNLSKHVYVGGLLVEQRVNGIRQYHQQQQMGGAAPLRHELRKCDAAHHQVYHQVERASTIPEIVL